MKIVLMSDSHGNSYNVEEVINANREADYFYHLGDFCDNEDLFPQISFVRGNNDFSFDMPASRIVSFGDFRIYMTHSHRIYGWGGDRKKLLAIEAKKQNCNVCFYGHTHIPDDCIVNGVRLLNPGSLYYNRDNSKIGYFVIDIDKNNFQVSRKLL